jgi:hypothetical protein
MPACFGRQAREEKEKDKEIEKETETNSQHADEGRDMSRMSENKKERGEKEREGRGGVITDSKSHSPTWQEQTWKACCLRLARPHSEAP